MAAASRAVKTAAGITARATASVILQARPADARTPAFFHARCRTARTVSTARARPRPCAPASERSRHVAAARARRELPRHRGSFTEGLDRLVTPRLEGGCHAGREDGDHGGRPSRQPPPPRLF